jgi:hypothetical protein
MLYLIIHPEFDYELFNDGDIRICTKELEHRIIEADSADDAIFQYANYNEGEVRVSSLKNYFALQVASRKCEIASKNLIDKISAKEQKSKEDEVIARELAELERLKKKFEGVKNAH